MFYIIFVFLFGSAVSMYSSKALEGYPNGYMSDCPGANITLPISTKDLKLLTIVVQSKGYAFSKRRSYDYFQMKNLSKDPAVDFTRPTVMYVGGYMDHPNYPPGLLLGTTYKQLGFNVLLLNTNYFTTTEYVLAARNIRSAGKHAAEMLASLTKYGLDPQKLSLVGLSLGGHTISFIAKNYRLLTGMNISRLTALDPSGPCFRNLGPNDRLDPSDADFVDVIKTNIDGFGMAAPIGHINFYVNGGEFQPGDILWTPCNVLCSHIRALTLWTAALNYPDFFIAMKCNSVQEARDRNCYDRVPFETNILGLNTDKSKQGVYYLATSNNYPYYLGDKGLKREYDFFDMKLNLSRRKKIKNVWWNLFS